MSAIDTMTLPTIELLDDAHCMALEAALVELVYQSNAESTGYADGRLVGGCMRTESGDLMGGVSGHTWGGACVVTHLWVARRYRGQGLGAALLKSVEAEARRRDCVCSILTTHDFQAPGFYERQGYHRLCTIEQWPIGHSNIVYRKRLDVDGPTRHL